MENKTNRALVVALIIFIVISLFLGGYIIFDKCLSKNDVKTTEPIQKEELNGSDESNIYESLDESDPLVSKAFSYVTVGYDLLDDLYSGKEATVANLSDNSKMALTLYAYTENNKITYCGEYTEVSEEKLKNLVLEDNSFLESFKDNTDQWVGDFSLEYSDGSFYISGSCDGMGPGPTPGWDYKFEGAIRNSEELFLDVKFMYYDWIDGVYDGIAPVFIFGTSLYFSEAVNNPIETFTSGGNFSADWDKYNTYQFKFKIDNNNLYFQSVSVV